MENLNYYIRKNLDNNIELINHDPLTIFNNIKNLKYPIYVQEKQYDLIPKNFKMSDFKIFKDKLNIPKDAWVFSIYEEEEL